ncbi:hypothetical protein [Nocardia sp. NPDC051463]|uniref:hypothetical protein n=1 Tax=Nocardia sp. NPDC051463 TaxID=3154845 RepID=UPI00344B73AF
MSGGWLAKTGAVPIGYYKDEEKTGRLPKTVDGTRTVVTDDRARAERDGSVTLIGRGNMVVDTGGEKVFVEEAMCADTSRATKFRGRSGSPRRYREHAVESPTTAGPRSTRRVARRITGRVVDVDYLREQPGRDNENVF